MRSRCKVERPQSKRMIQERIEADSKPKGKVKGNVKADQELVRILDPSSRDTMKRMKKGLMRVRLQSVSCQSHIGKQNSCISKSDQIIDGLCSRLCTLLRSTELHTHCFVIKCIEYKYKNRSSTLQSEFRKSQPCHESSSLNVPTCQNSRLASIQTLIGACLHRCDRNRKRSVFTVYIIPIVSRPSSLPNRRWLRIPLSCLPTLASSAVSLQKASMPSS